MILHAHWQGSHHSSRPVLVWLHGFLGSSADWLPVQSGFSDWPQLSIDLPGHGGSRAQQISDFDQQSARLTATLHHHRIRRYWLIGYSLGGRIAMFHACRHSGAELAGLVVESAHHGLNADDRAHRLAADRRWATRFCQQPLHQTLDEWYRQPVFADLSAAQRQQLISLRSHNHPQALASMLLATSLAKQPNLLPELQRLPCPVYSLCGEQDAKFSQLARQAALPCDAIPAAGHNAHRANPGAFGRLLAQKLSLEEST